MDTERISRKGRKGAKSAKEAAYGDSSPFSSCLSYYESGGKGEEEDLAGFFMKMGRNH
jgi:hypothetical protein